MVPDPDSTGAPAPDATDEPRGNDRLPDDVDPESLYDLVYRATRDALWDVLGTATLLLFYLLLAAIALSVAVGGLGPLLRGSASPSALGIGLLAAGVGLFALFRVYRLATE
ncbi:hypothetical protein [Halobellus clavatus]|jgi:hypothetical protein|uniref:Uncharacterized protein n=1 Tax=Halobellus clavatus TaxID=660517 RepID=A0A1H3EID4_9EURY|nr:hypothetical protein [Halobellus clavatus]SDX78522.1 hypothetical protein SAMN04487946_102309 [Halobellus clavatus]